MVVILRHFKKGALGLWGVASRRKRLSDEPSELARVLNVLDLTMLGVGATLGLGVYVLAGKVANGEAGPAVIVSFLIAAIASLFAGLCYAEFAARVPKAGSAYVYAYVAVGEVVAFVIGWTLILEYAIGTSSIARGVSTYIDAVVDHRLSDFFLSTMPLNTSILADYADPLAVAIVAVMTALLAFGIKESSFLNNILTFLNLVTVVTAVVTGAIHADPRNWSLPPRPGVDQGGFLPFGIRGVVQGAASCFFGFVGFDGIATTSEEAKNPRRNIPLAIILSLIVVVITYCSIAVVLTLVRPYFELDKDATFTVLFRDMEMFTIMWIVTAGAIFALTASLVGVMFPLPRIMYAMAQDGLIFSQFARVNDYTKTPVIATLVAGLLCASLALIFNLDQLTEMMSIGTLLAYTVVGLCVLVLRYTGMGDDEAPEKSEPLTLARSLGMLVNWERAKRPSSRTSGAACILIFAQIVLSLALCWLLKLAGNDLYEDPEPWLGPILALLVPIIIVVVMLDQQPKTNVTGLSFTVPLLPYLPAISLFLNVYLMVYLDVRTWYRFAVWMAVGALMYFGYSLRHSTERRLQTADRMKKLSKVEAMDVADGAVYS